MLKTFNSGFIVALVSLAFVGCTSENEVLEQNSSSVNYRKLSINFFDASVQKIDGAITRGDDDVALSNFFGRLDVALISASQTDKIYAFNQLASDDNFGKMSVTVPVGTYHLVGIANKKDDGAVAATIKSKEYVSFEGNKVGDVACVYKQVEVKDQEPSSSIACQLKRVVSLFRLACLDDIPKDVASVTFEIKGKCSYWLNPSTASAADIKDGGISKNYNVSAYSDDSRKNKSFDFYMFLADDTETVNVTVTLWSDTEKKNALKTLTFSDVTLKVNHVTTYTGKLFEESNALSFTFSDGEMTSSDADKSF